MGGVAAVDYLDVAVNRVVSGGVNVTLTLSCEFTAAGVTNALSMRPFLPSQLRIATTTSRTYKASIPSTASLGSYRLAFTLSGRDAASVDLVVSGSVGDVFTVVSPSQPYRPAPPNITSALYTDDGSGFTVSFDVATDLANNVVGTSFACGSLLQFRGSELASCLWTSSVVLQIRPSGAQRPSNNDKVTLLGGKLRARCISKDASVCDTYARSATQAVTVGPPANPISPVVLVTAPTTIGPCTSFSLDLSRSQGHMYTSWKSVTITVLRNGSSDAALNTFFANRYVSSPPTPVNATLLEPGMHYSFAIRLCNVFNLCSAVATHELSVESSVVPVVSVYGDLVRSVYRPDKVTLYSAAYVELCTGSTSSSGLVYSWRVWKDGVAGSLDSSVSTSRPILAIPGGVLSSGSVYEIMLAVTHTRSLVETLSAPVRVTVLQAALRAVIAGASDRSVGLGSSLALDASGSYDPDGSSPTLNYEWTCETTAPLDPSMCPFSFSSNTASRVTIHTISPSAAVDQVVKVSVRVHDASRQDQVSVTVRIMPAAAPSVTILSSSGVVETIQQKGLQIRSQISLQTSATAVWSVSGVDGLSLGAIASSVTSTSLEPGRRWFNLVIKPNTLPTYATLTFTLSCGASSSSVSVRVAGPPQPGLFEVSPTAGVALMDEFVFSTSLWSDEHLPITFTFGSRGADGDLWILKSRSELSMTSSVLSQGSADGGSYNSTCVVQAFNALDAFSELSMSVQVWPVDMTARDLDIYLTKQLAYGANQSSWDPIMQIVSGGAAELNDVNCTLAPSCSILHRYGCGISNGKSAADHTCGACMPGYLGPEAPSNVRCVLTTSSPPNQACASDSDCSLFMSCNSTSSRCVSIDKQCESTCTRERGVCEMRATSTNALLPLGRACVVGDPSCFARCACSEGFFGSGCLVSSNDQHYYETSRMRMIEALSAVIVESDSGAFNDGSALVSWVTSVVALSNDKGELTGDMCDLLSEMVASLLDHASDNDVPYQSVLDLSIVVSNCLEALQLSPELDDTEGYSQLYAVQDLHARYIAERMVDGENSVTSVNSLYRMVLTRMSPAANATIAMTTPSSDADTLFGVAPSTVLIRSGDSTGQNSSSVIIVESAAQLYGNGSESISTIIKIEVSDRSIFSDTVEFYFRTQQKQSDFFVDPSWNETFSTECSGYAAFVSNYTCSNGFVVTHECNRSIIGVLQTSCPWTAYRPQCAISIEGVLVVHPDVCRLVEFTDDVVTCSCSLAQALAVGGGNSGRRRLGSEQNIGYLEAAAMSQSVGVEFKDTLLYAKGLSVADLKSSVLVITFFASMWVSVLGVVLFLMLSDNSDGHAPVKDLSFRNRRHRRSSPVGNGGPGNKKSNLRVHLMKYIDMIIPVVFRPKQSYFTSLFEELGKHHRYRKRITSLQNRFLIF
jgi:hypothetical protein